MRNGRRVQRFKILLRGSSQTGRGRSGAQLGEGWQTIALPIPQRSNEDLMRTLCGLAATVGG
jgi:hypothetical protein